LIYIPAIVIAELYYLNEKKGRPLDFRAKYARLAQSKQFVLLPFHPSHTLDFDACSAVTEIAIESTIANAFNQIAENSLSDPRPKQSLYFIAA
jgi:predicted nucleic acid-binding protein